MYLFRRVDHTYRSSPERSPYGSCDRGSLSHRCARKEEPWGVQGLHLLGSIKAIKGKYFYSKGLFKYFVKRPSVQKVTVGFSIYTFLLKQKRLRDLDNDFHLVFVDLSINDPQFHRFPPPLLPDLTIMSPFIKLNSPFNCWNFHRNLYLISLLDQEL